MTTEFEKIVEYDEEEFVEREIRRLKRVLVRIIISVEKKKLLFNRGFTIIELLIAMCMFAFVVGGLYKVFISMTHNHAAQERLMEMSQSARVAIDRMSHDIRLAGYKTSTATFNGIATANSTMIRVLTDLNQDGDTSDSFEDITYSFNGSEIVLTANSTSEVLCENVHAATFSYVLANGTTTSTPSDMKEIRQVLISITVNTDGQVHNTKGSMTLNTIITPRNLGV